MLCKLIALWQLLVTRYYMVEFNIDSEQHGKQGPYPALNHIGIFGGCRDTGIFTDWKAAKNYWMYRTDDQHDPGFTYQITCLPRSHEAVRDFIASQQGK